jgi:OmcA/MtrC family decaheme c-type cytochrome
MKKETWKKGRIFFLIPLLVLALALTGCEGDDGAPGPPGPPGQDASTVLNASVATPEALAALTPVATITGVTIAGAPVVSLTVTDATTGVGITGIGLINDANPGYVRMDIAKLVPGTNGDPNVWVNYIRSSTTNAPTTERTGTLVDNGDGSYTYTFETDISTVAGIPYEPTLTHRVAGQIGSSSIALAPMNLAFDFVPAGGAVTTTRNIVNENQCNECHNPLVIHGRRFKTDYCVTCHNPDLASGEGDMPFMVHRIHIAGAFAILDDAVDYAEVTYPQDVRNCRKCHSGNTDSDNWMSVPTLAACSGCHESNTFPGGPIDFATGAGHLGGIQTDNSGCAGCHNPTQIVGYHVTDNATVNNPEVPAGAVNFAYEIIEVTVDATNQAVIDFRITADGTPVDLTTFPPTGFTGGPSFLLAYAQPQGAITAPTEYNNLGRAAAQPASVSIASLFAGTNGTLTAGAGGIYTATITSAPFPAGATLRAVGLQGYFTQVAPAVARHTQSVVKAVTGDANRRAVVSSAACAACHEIFEGHGGNRVLTADGGVEICLMCHVPNLSSSGRAIDPALAADRDGDPLTIDPSAATVDLGTADTWTWPEDTNNFKDMIHGIHASGFRTFDYEFVRGRNDGIYYNWAEVTFPGEVGICTTCHLNGTWALPLNNNALPTTVRTTGTADGLDGDDFTAVQAARASVPNVTDWVNTPTASACYYCHDTDLAIAHMRQNGGVISIADTLANSFTQRQDLNTVESCAICHGPGKQADVEFVHGL